MPFTQKTTLTHENPPNIALFRPSFSDTDKDSERVSNKEIEIQCSEPPPPGNSPVCNNLTLPNTDTHLTLQPLQHNRHQSETIKNKQNYNSSRCAPNTAMRSFSYRPSSFSNLPSVINRSLTDGNRHASEITEDKQNFHPFRCAPNTAMRSFSRSPLDRHHPKTTTQSDITQAPGPTSRMKNDELTPETCHTYDNASRQPEKTVSANICEPLICLSSTFLSGSIIEILDRLDSGNKTGKTDRQAVIDIGIDTLGSLVNKLRSSSDDAQCFSSSELVINVLTDAAHTFNGDSSKEFSKKLIDFLACDVPHHALEQLFKRLNGTFSSIVLTSTINSVRTLIREIWTEGTQWSEKLLQFLADLIVNIGSYGSGYLAGIILGAIGLPPIAAQILIPVATNIVRWGARKALKKVCQYAKKTFQLRRNYPEQNNFKNQNELLNNSPDERPQLISSSSSSPSSSSSSPSSSSSSPLSSHPHGVNVSAAPTHKAVSPKISIEQIYSTLPYIDEDSPEVREESAENRKSRSDDEKGKRRSNDKKRKRRNRTTARADKERRGTTQQWHPFGGKQDTSSETARAAHRLAKDQNRVARSAQPEELILIDDRNPEAKTHKNPQPKIRLYRYKNVDGGNVYLRHDTPRTYANEGGIGAQGPHINAGSDSDPEDIKQHHYYGKQPGDNNVSKK